VHDFVKWAHDHGIPAVARGSGCSTVIGYCLRISTVDPLHYGLYFERFMDPERDEMPDIDVDLCQDRRAQVIDYVRQKYGHVAQIITFGRLKAKAAIRDICRVLDVPLAEADRVAKLVPEELKMTIDKAIAREPELKKLYDGNPVMRKVLEIAKRLEGMARHASVHAAGVVIADKPLDTFVPLHKAADADAKDVTTQFEGPTVEKSRPAEDGLSRPADALADRSDVQTGGEESRRERRSRQPGSDRPAGLCAAGARRDKRRVSV
jgi:DNA polymerase-3 subunit alpha